MRLFHFLSIVGFVMGGAGSGCGDNITGAGGDGGIPGNDAIPDSPLADSPPADGPPADGPPGDGPLSNAPTLLISEVTLSNNSQEFIEIYNPTNQAVDLGNYYICDDDEYYLLPGASGAGPAPMRLNENPVATMQFDFLVKFPTGASIPAGGVVVVAMRFNDFNTANPTRNADFGILQAPVGKEMIDPGNGVFVGRGGNAQFSQSGGEMVALFLWDGTSDLVKDIDLVNVGTNADPFNRIPSKTGKMVDGPDSDTTPSRYAMDRATIGLMDGVAPTGQSHKRVALEIGSEVQDGFGNGLTGHDETSEDTTMTWDRASAYTAPTPGSVPPALMP